MLTYYKPNKANRGILANFKLISKQSRDTEPFKEGCVYLSLVKQTGWNEERKTGSFKNGDSINIKFPLIELSKWLGAIERNTKFDTVHRSKDMVSIVFSPWLVKGSDEQAGYGLYVNRDREGVKEQFSFALRMGEEVALREFLKLAIEHLLLSNYAEEKRRFKAAYAAKSQVVSVRDDEPAESDSDDDVPLFG